LGKREKVQQKKHVPGTESRGSKKRVWEKGQIKTEKIRRPRTERGRESLQKGTKEKEHVKGFVNSDLIGKRKDRTLSDEKTNWI